MEKKERLSLGISVRTKEEKDRLNKKIRRAVLDFDYPSQFDAVEAALDLLLEKK